MINSPCHDRQAFAAYVTNMSAQLARLSRSHGFDTLAYLLDMVQFESSRNLVPPMLSNFNVNERQGSEPSIAKRKTSRR